MLARRLQHYPRCPRMGAIFKLRYKISVAIALVVVKGVSLFATSNPLATSTSLALLRFDREAHDRASPRHPLLFVAPSAGANSRRPLDRHPGIVARILIQQITKLVPNSSVPRVRSRWVGRIGGGGISVQRGTAEGLGRDMFMMAASGGGNTEANGAGDNAGNGDEDIDWGKINPKEGQKPDWDKILPKNLDDKVVEMPPEPESFSEMDPQERLRAYAGMLDWKPLDLNAEEPKEKTYEDLSEEMQNDWLAKQLQSALKKNRNVEKNVNKWYVEGKFEDAKEDLQKTAQELKEQYAKDAERIQKELLEEFDKGARVMDIKIANIIDRGRGNFTRATRPLSETTPFPASASAAAVDEGGFYEELEDDAMTAEERSNQIEAEFRMLSPRDVVSAAAAQALARANKNASANAAVARRADEAAGNVVIVGASDGDLGSRVLGLFEKEAEVEEGGTEVKGRGAGVVSVAGISLKQARTFEDDEKVEAYLRRVNTLVIVPADDVGDESGSSAKSKGAGVGGMLGGFFGGGGGGVKGEEGAGLTDEEATRVLGACGEGLKHVVCLSVGAAGGSGGGGLFGGGGQDDKNFPPESEAEQAVIRVAKVKGLTYTTVRVTKLGGSESVDGAPLPLITPKNAPRPTTAGGRLPDASRSIAANALFRASYQPESRRNSTLAVSDFPKSSAASKWPVPASGWDDEFLKLTGPELFRVAIPGEFEEGGGGEGSGTFKAWSFLREWAQLWTKEGTGLTTRVKVFTDDDKRRTGLYFDPSRTPYMSAKEERDAEEARGKGTNVSSRKNAARNSLGQEGGIDIVVEDEPYPRVRAMRANMGPNTVVKEMSERLILDKLKKDVKTFIIDSKKAR